MTTEKQDFLVAYDYGMGGLWAILAARSEDEINERYPELGIATDRPSWMTASDFRRLMRNERHDIDEEPTGVLAAVVADRRK
jgi:hypothetical protein